MQKHDKYALIGLIVGIVITVMLWILVADQIEMNKVNNGYLTFENKTYTVTLYDSLDKPEKDTKD